MVESLEGQQDALLESPTGTGKTLSLLTASLGWLKTNQDNGLMKGTKIFYASRTHSQLKQLVSELKKTVYRPVTAVLGSRDQLCVNSKLGGCSGTEKNNRCSKLVLEGKCKHFNTLRSKKITAMEIYSQKILDIEELVGILNY